MSNNIISSIEVNQTEYNIADRTAREQLIPASDTTLGLIKTNPSAGIDITADGKLTVAVPISTSDLLNDGEDGSDTFATYGDVDYLINNAVASAYKFKGSVQTITNLPTTKNKIGDVYDVQETGMNYAWNGTAWDALGQYVDTSSFATKNYVDNKTWNASDITSGILPIERGGTGYNNAWNFLEDALDQTIEVYQEEGFLYREYDSNTRFYGTIPASKIEIPNLDASKITSGSFTVARGGTGRNTLTSGSYLVGNGTSSVTLKTPAQVLDDIGAAAVSDIPEQATADVLGLVKLNPNKSVTLNADGQLEVGGRLGQAALGGLFYPLTSIPVQGSSNSFLLSEAVGLSIGSRSMAIAGGNNVTLKVTAAAGATTYEIANTQNNRFICACWIGGRLAISQAEATEKTVAIASVKFANGNNVTPYFGAAEDNNNIIVTVDESLNPNDTLTAVRGYGKFSGTDTLSVGQGNGSIGSKTLLVGMSLYTNPGGQNQIAMIGNRMYTTRGSCILVGADNINASQYGAIFGEGHNSTGGPSAISLFGRYSSVDSDTLMAVGKGTDDANRSNAFEVKTDGRIKASGTPIDSNDLTTKAYVDSAIDLDPQQTEATADTAWISNATANNFFVAKSGNNALLRISGVKLAQSLPYNVNKTIGTLPDGYKAFCPVNGVLFDVSVGAVGMVSVSGSNIMFRNTTGAALSDGTTLYGTVGYLTT